jgi:hypothetical protein
VSVKADSMAESSIEQTSEDLIGMKTIFDNSPIPPKQIMTGIVVVVGLFLFFNLVSNLSEQQTDVIPKINTEVPLEVENKGEIKSIPVERTEVVNEANTATSATEEQTEPTKDVKKKP